MNDIIREVIGGLIALLAVIILLGLTTFIYYKIDKIRNKKGKSDAAFRVMFVIVLITFITRFICVLNIYQMHFENESFFTGAYKAIALIYSTLGGLTFEGQEGEFISSVSTNKGDLPFGIAYLATILWMSGSFVIIITFGLRFEFACQAKLFLLRHFTKMEYINIFTAVTDDTLSLAASIEEKHKRNKEKSVIIFTGGTIGQFDKNNEYHRRLRSLGFLFISIPKGRVKLNENGLLIGLHLSRKGHRLYKKLAKTRVRIFAFDNDEKDMGLESMNSEVVFTDISKSLKQIVDDKERSLSLILDEKKIFIDYYVLTNNTINYEFYEKVLNNLIIHECIKKLKKDEKEGGISEKTIFEELKALFQIHVINEAYLAGEDLIRMRQRQFDKELDDLYPIINDSSKNDEYRVVVIGFGLTGQKSLDNLFQDSTSLLKINNKPSGSPRKFRALLCDKNMSSVIGGYIKRHPSYLFKTVKKGTTGFNFEGSEQIEQFYNFDGLKDAYKIENFLKADAGLAFPRIYFMESDYNNPDFLLTVDKFCGSSSKYSAVDAFIISLGSDEENIKAANAILQDIRQENYEDGLVHEITSKQKIFVHIRDNSNISRLNWNQHIEETTHRNIRVYVYGNATYLYTHKNIVAQSKSVQVNYLYENLGNSYESLPLSELYNLTPNEKELTKSSQEDQEYLFRKLSLDKKNSNHYASLFALYYAKYEDVCKKKNVPVDYVYLSKLEHFRWCRYCMANGYLFSSSYFDELGQISTSLKKQTDKAELSQDDLDNLAKLAKIEKEFDDNGYFGVSGIKEYGKNILKIHNKIIPYDFNSITVRDKMYDIINVKYARYLMMDFFND